VQARGGEDAIGCSGHLGRSAEAAIEIAISDCVQRFYAKGLADPLLGPIFSAIPDLPAHLEIIKNFWSRSLLGTERYQGHPYPVHTSLRIEPEHFQRWLELFIESTRETLQSRRPNRPPPGEPYGSMFPGGDISLHRL